MNKNSLIGSILIAAIVIWWMTMSSNNAKQQAEAQAKEKEAAAAMEAARADSADQLVLGDKTPELKAAPVLGDDNLDERRETRDESESGKVVVADSAKVASAAADSVTADSAQAAEAPKVVEPRTVTVETDKFIMTLSNKGARVQSVIVKALPDSAGNFPEIIQDTALGALDLKIGKADLTEALFDLGDTPEKIKVENDVTVQFTFTDASGKQVIRSYGFTKAGVAVRQVNRFVGFKPADYELSWKGGMKETEVMPKGKSFGGASYFFSEVIFKNSEITERETFSDAMTFDNANYYWVGMRRKYVALSVQFDKPVPVKVNAKHIDVATEGNPDPGTYSLTIADGIRGDSLAYNFMVLPLQWDEVEALDQGYEKIIVTGSKWFPGSSVWFVWICKWLLKLLKFFYSIIPNYGVAIILVTFIVRAFTTPFTVKQLKSTRAMSKLKPQLDEINVKYRSDPQKKQAAIMELYAKNGVNPLASCTGGCLPMLIQMPIFMGLFFVLGRAIELRGMPAFLWITDLSKSDVVWSGFSIPFVMPAGLAILPWIMVVTTYFQTKVTMSGSAGMDPIVSNFWSIAQYKFINRGVMAQGSESSKLKGKDVQDAKIVK